MTLPAPAKTSITVEQENPHHIRFFIPGFNPWLSIIMTLFVACFIGAFAGSDLLFGSERNYLRAVAGDTWAKVADILILILVPAGVIVMLAYLNQTTTLEASRTSIPTLTARTRNWFGGATHSWPAADLCRIELGIRRLQRGKSVSYSLDIVPKKNLGRRRRYIIGRRRVEIEWIQSNLEQVLYGPNS